MVFLLDGYRRAGAAATTAGAVARAEEVVEEEMVVVVVERELADWAGASCCIAFWDALAGGMELIFPRVKDCFDTRELRTLCGLCRLFRTMGVRLRFSFYSLPALEVTKCFVVDRYSVRGQGEAAGGSCGRASYRGIVCVFRHLSSVYLFTNLPI